MDKSKLLKYWQNLDAFVIVLGLSVGLCIGLYMAAPRISAYLGPGSYAPIGSVKLCKILQRGGKEINCEGQMRIDDMLEDAFPTETTTRGEVRSILDELWLESFTLAYNEDIVIDVYAVDSHILNGPDTANFSFSQDGMLQKITFTDGWL